MRLKASTAAWYAWPRGELCWMDSSMYSPWVRVWSRHSTRYFQRSASTRRRRRWVHSAETRVSTRASWLWPVGWNSRWNAAERAASAARSSSRMISAWASMPDFRALSEETALPSEEVGPVDFWELRRLASSWAWDDMI